MMKTRHWMTGLAICLLVLVSAGCRTSPAEWSGRMPNERGTHVKPYDFDQPDQQTENEAVRPIEFTFAMKLAHSSAVRPDVPFNRADRLLASPLRKSGFALRGFAGKVLHDIPFAGSE